jgi:hypothetical protein
MSGTERDPEFYWIRLGGLAPEVARWDAEAGTREAKARACRPTSTPRGW